MRRANQRQAEQRLLEFRYAEDNATSSSLDESFGSVEYASELEERCPAISESDAVPRSRDTCRRLKKGGKGGLVRPRQQRCESGHVGNLDKHLAAVCLGSPASSEGSSINNRDCASPSGKASSLESTRVRAGSYHLSADGVPSRYDSQRVASQIRKKKLARADKKRRGD